MVEPATTATHTLHERVDLACAPSDTYTTDTHTEDMHGRHAYETCVYATHE